MITEMNFTAAADYTGMKETTFRRLCKEGKGPKSRAEGRTYRFLPEHLDTWLEDYKAVAYKPSKPAKNGKQSAKGILD